MINNENIYYISTRSKDGKKYTSAEVIKNGLADDGGLFVPEHIPTITYEDIDAMRSMTYAERAARVLGMFLTDYDSDELLCAANSAYSAEHFGEHPAPLCMLCGNVGVLELWHGPTAAFKDMALQIMPRLLSLSLGKTDEKRDALILVATSGDTGKAALEGFSGVDRTKIHVFYPSDGVSDMQKRQMATTVGDNVRVTAVRGNFDDCQSGVKKIFSDTDAAKQLSQKGVFLSSANSINFGRLAPQIVYYISAYCDLLEGGMIQRGDKIDITVPTGNFGNIFAAFIAKKMGLPVGRLVCASNKNHILTDFMETGVYDRNREFYATTSPSMDILISSNLERLLYFVAGTEKTREYMHSLATCGRFEVDETIMQKIRSDFVAAYADEEQCVSVIADIFDQFNYLCDTHTAVAMHCANKYKNGNTVMLVASTASPYKFAPAVLSALGSNGFDGYEALVKLHELTGAEIPSCLCDVMSKQIRFKDVIDPSEMQATVIG